MGNNRFHTKWLKLIEIMLSRLTNKSLINVSLTLKTHLTFKRLEVDIEIIKPEVVAKEILH